MQILKQSTAVTVVLGPFLDDADGKTAETGLTISQADIRLSKNGGAFAQTNNATGATHMENGYYSVPLDTTDANAVGRLRVAISESGALPVWQDFQIVEEAVYDAFFATSAGMAVTLADGAITAAKIASDAGTEIGTAVWASATRLLTAGTNIVLAKDTGVTGFNDLDAAGVRTAVGLTSANLDTQLAAIDNFIDTEVAAIKAVTDNLPDSGALTSLATATALTTIDTVVDAIKLKTDNLPSDPADQSLIIAATDSITTAIGNLNDLSAADVLGATVAEGFSTAGENPTLAQILHEIRQGTLEFAISGTTLTVKKQDGSTTAMTFTLDDDTNPTSRTRAA